jgi:sugar O-acyltransferase (sialic acid O-acetyltransferase NeuD family)
MDRRVVILGGLGDGSVVAEVLLNGRLAGSENQLIGFLNDEMSRGDTIYDFPVLGHLDDWRELDSDISFVWALQRVGLMPERVQRFEGLAIPLHRFVAVRHPQSYVASTAEIGPGSFIASFATVQPMARIGAFAGLRAGVSIGHHAQVGAHAYVGPNSTMCGYSRLGTGACLGPNAVIIEHKSLGEFAIAGIGAAVTKDVPPHGIAMGNPARSVRVMRAPVVVYTKGQKTPAITEEGIGEMAHGERS